MLVGGNVFFSVTRTIPGYSTFQRLALHLYCIFGKLHQHTAYWETWETGTGEGLGGAKTVATCAGGLWQYVVLMFYLTAAAGFESWTVRFGADHDSPVSKPLV